ncbi:hypothetical protein, partial [Klebsiella pneumoniae]|uniref:hypothetical protein n=1 Tax=Klebsiella pneumoniae TaxID=573 RepID=UPI0037159192
MRSVLDRPLDRWIAPRWRRYPRDAPNRRLDETAFTPALSLIYDQVAKLYGDDIFHIHPTRKIENDLIATLRDYRAHPLGKAIA